MPKTCVDCAAILTGHGTPKRCRSCAARERYIARFGHAPKILLIKCEVCRKEKTDYASNHANSKHGVFFCSKECRAAWTGVRNSISRGGDGIKKSKSDRDKIYYRENCARIRKSVREKYSNNRVEVLNILRLRTRAIKEEVVKAYGGKCKCCGETHIEFLTIDHTNGDGASHRKQCGKGRGIYADLKKRGFPQVGYRCLCLNCNIAIGFYGYCPHRPDIKRAMNKIPGKHSGKVGRPKVIIAKRP